MGSLRMLSGTSTTSFTMSAGRWTARTRRLRGDSGRRQGLRGCVSDQLQRHCPAPSSPLARPTRSPNQHPVSTIDVVWSDEDDVWVDIGDVSHCSAVADTPTRPSPGWRLRLNLGASGQGRAVTMFRSSDSCPSRLSRTADVRSRTRDAQGPVRCRPSGRQLDARPRCAIWRSVRPRSNSWPSSTASVGMTPTVRRTCPSDW